MATKKRPTDIFQGLRRFFLVVVGAALFLEAGGGTSDPWSVWARLYHDPFSAWHTDLQNWGADQSSAVVGGSLWFFDWKDIRIIISPLDAGSPFKYEYRYSVPLLVSSKSRRTAAGGTTPSLAYHTLSLWPNSRK